MSLAIVFLVALAGSFTALFWRGFRTLPAERWQFLACCATRRAPGGEWAGVNFTYYGLFSALAYTGGTALFLVLSAAAGAAPLAAVVSVALVVAVCLPPRRSSAWSSASAKASPWAAAASSAFWRRRWS